MLHEFYYKRNQAADESDTSRCFRTKIYPKKDEIDVCSKFLKQHENNIDFHIPAWITTVGKGVTMVTFKLDNGDTVETVPQEGSHIKSLLQHCNHPSHHG
ncbi:unnamed protein product [Trifolium pratense]|uniref:Uncharacterized protein n=1 Tax=Trifolium pratense TaxID=57577 RepID=A0ACB0KC72_TRIPR|nr:unnamed protein product [Trifolium pratense]